MNSLKNKVIIITGASSGIGRALAEESLRHQMKVVLAARRVDVMESFTSDQQWDTDDFLLVKTDISLESDCRNLIDQTIQKYGKIDILVNNAGVSMRALFTQLDLDVIRKLMDVNFWGTVYCCYYAMPWILKSKGSVVGVSSVAGYKGLPARTGYSASKFAIRGFLETLRAENLKNDIHIMNVCPGFTASNIRKTALNGNGKIQGESPRNENSMMTAQEVAKSILKGIKKKKRTIILTNVGKLTVFLSKFFPSLVDNLVYKSLAKEPDSPLK
ncbi:MAG: SDR family oxidoreductase [Bacteroidales bacterium]